MADKQSILKKNEKWDSKSKEYLKVVYSHFHCEIIDFKNTFKRDQSCNQSKGTNLLANDENSQGKQLNDILFFYFLFIIIFMIQHKFIFWKFTNTKLNDKSSGKM